MSMPKAGDKAPNFSLSDSNGREITLDSLKGKNIVLYFYPKDDTPGCTVEAEEFSREINKFAEKNAVVLGVSKDSVESHCKFQEKYKLEVQLLSDPTGKTIEAYGCWVEKNKFGKKSMGIQRATFIIGNGNIKHVFPKVKPEGHAAEVLQLL